MTWKNLKQYRDGGMLAEGEENRPYRIRAAAEIHEWLTGLSATERGEILTQAYAAYGRPMEAPLESQPPQVSEWVEQRRFKPPGAMAPAAMSDLGTELLPVELELTVSLTKLTTAQRGVMEAIAIGARLYRRGQAGSYVLVMPDGEERGAHSGTVRALLRGN